MCIGGVGSGSGCRTTGSQKEGGRECRGGNSPVAAALIEPPMEWARLLFANGPQNAEGVDVIDWKLFDWAKVFGVKLGVTPNW